MSSMRLAVVFVSRLVPRTAAFGMLRPPPALIKQSHVVCSRVKEAPMPGRTTQSRVPRAQRVRAFPFGFPHCSQKTRCPAPTSRYPCA